ncbi:MAG: HAD family hydrolase [Acidobacteria bacterium]|nr:HAD family hydrolase [Acidobacteriota bacterium]
MPRLRSGSVQPQTARRNPRLPLVPADGGAGPRVTVREHGLILDLDGTLVDSYRPIAESLNHARAHYHLEPLDLSTVRAEVGHGLEQLIGRWIGADRIEDGVRLFRERYGEVFQSATEPLPGVDAALRRLAHAGYRLALASNKPARFSRVILRHLGWESLFSAVEGPDTVGSAKPDPAMLLACLAALGTPADRTRYVGDMPLDEISGGRAHLAVILVRGGSASETDLRNAGSPVLTGFAALPEFLSDLGWPVRPAPAPEDQDRP